MNTQKMDAAYIAHTYARFPLEIVKGRGSIATGADGREYIDLTSGIAVNSFGMCDPDWVEAIVNQLGQVAHTSNLFYTAPAPRLAQMLCERTGMARAFFSNSGAEANECAIKAARKYAAMRCEQTGMATGSDSQPSAATAGTASGTETSPADDPCTFAPPRHTILTLSDSFHGRTITTLAATGQAHYHQLFRPLTPGIMSVRASDGIAAVEQAHQERPLAGVMIEIVQGEGGIHALEPRYVKDLAAWCTANDVPLIVDEVQTGNGRTGELYAYMHYGIQPDIVTTAKGLGGGLPIGATLLSEKLKDVFQPGDHGSTFGGNPVVCAGAISIVERLSDELMADVRQKSDFIFSELEGADGVEHVSGMGLMIGITTAKPAKEVLAQCREQGVLVLTAKDKVRLLPPLNIPMDLLSRAIGVIKSVCAS